MFAENDGQKVEEGRFYGIKKEKKKEEENMELEKLEFRFWLTLKYLIDKWGRQVYGCKRTLH